MPPMNASSIMALLPAAMGSDSMYMSADPECGWVSRPAATIGSTNTANSPR